MKNINPLGFFDDHFLFEKLTKLKNPRAKLDEHIDLKIFAPTFDVTFNEPKNSNAVDRPPFNRLMMFKLLLLQSLYSPSDDQMEYQITDKLSFKRFLGLKSSNHVPDSKTIWKFCETLTQEEVVEAFFYRFNTALDDKNIFFAKNGHIVDASIVGVPQQRNTRDGNKQIKQGQTLESWQKRPNKLWQKDGDARWMRKNKMNLYGYENHVKVNHGKKLISSYSVSDAATHDSQKFENLIDKDDAGQKLYGDSVYTGQGARIVWCGMIAMIQEKGTACKPLKKQQKTKNRKKSWIHSRVEHVFGYMTNTMKAMNIRAKELERATAKIDLTNLTYNNMIHCLQLEQMCP